MSCAAVRRTAHAGVAAALAYAALKAAWGLGSRVGVTDPEAFDAFAARFGALEWVATWGTVALALVAAGLLLALLRVRARPLRVAAWLGAAVLAIPGFGGLAEALLIAAGAIDAHDNGLAPWVFVLTYGAFSVLAVAFVVASRPVKAC
jgi:hypothetical protein